MFWELIYNLFLKWNQGIFFLILLIILWVTVSVFKLVVPVPKLSYRCNSTPMC